jgi:hypothetical protein
MPVLPLLPKAAQTVGHTALLLNKLVDCTHH